MKAVLSLQSCDVSGDHLLLVSSSIGMITSITPWATGSSSPKLCAEVHAEMRLPRCSRELPWHCLTTTTVSQRTTMLLLTDPVRTAKDYTHITHSILLRQPRQAKRCQGCHPKIGHIPPAWSSVSGLTWEHQEEHG